METPHWNRLILKDCILWEGNHTGAGEEHGEEEVSEAMRYGLMTVSSILHPPELLGGWM